MAETEPPDASRSNHPPGDASIKTFLIADVRGYTLFTQTHGDEAAAKLAARFAGDTADAGRVAATSSNERSNPPARPRRIPCLRYPALLIRGHQSISGYRLLVEAPAAGGALPV